MANSTDFLQTIFSVAGVSSVVSAYVSVGQAAQRAANAQANAQKTANNPKATPQQVSRAQNLAMFGQIAVLQQIGSGFERIVAKAGEAVDSYVQLGKTIENVRDLTGSSTREAAGFASLFRVAGINDATEIRDFIRTAKDLRTAGGSHGLMQLGVTPKFGQSGTQLFSQILDKASALGPGLKRTFALQEVFGARGAQALMPLLRMTKEEREEAMRLGNIFGGPALDSIQDFQIQTALLGQTFLSNIVYPMVQAVLPAITLVAKEVKSFFALFDSPAMQAAAAFVAVAAAITSIGTAVTLLLPLMEKWNLLAKIQAGWDAIIDALTGKWGALALAGGLAVAGGVYYYSSQNQDSGNNDATDKNTAALQANTAAIVSLNPMFSKLLGQGIPSQFVQMGGLQTLEGQMAMGAIG